MRPTRCKASLIDRSPRTPVESSPTDAAGRGEESRRHERLKPALKQALMRFSRRQLMDVRYCIAGILHATMCIYASSPNHLLASGGGDEAEKFGSERSSTARGIHEVVSRLSPAHYGETLLVGQDDGEAAVQP
jgi:hypothetical protein